MNIYARKLGMLNFSKLIEDDHLSVQRGEAGKIIPYSMHVLNDNEHQIEILYGQIIKNNVNGIGRKVSLLACGDVLINEGQFKNNLLDGFGRFIVIKVSGKYDATIGFWHEGAQHGYSVEIEDDEV